MVSPPEDDERKGETGNGVAGRAAEGEAKGERDRAGDGGWVPGIEVSERDDASNEDVDGTKGDDEGRAGRGAGVRLLPMN